MPLTPFLHTRPYQLLHGKNQTKTMGGRLHGAWRSSTLVLELGSCMGPGFVVQAKHAKRPFHCSSNGELYLSPLFAIPVSFWMSVCLSMDTSWSWPCLSQLNSEADSTISWSTSEFRNEQRCLRFRVAAWSLQSAQSGKDGATSRPWSTGGNSIDMHHGSCSSSSLVACSFFSNLKPEMDQST